MMAFVFNLDSCLLDIVFLVSVKVTRCSGVVYGCTDLEDACMSLDKGQGFQVGGRGCVGEEGCGAGGCVGIGFLCPGAGPG